MNAKLSSEQSFVDFASVRLLHSRFAELPFDEDQVDGSGGNSARRLGVSILEAPGYVPICLPIMFEPKRSKEADRVFPHASINNEISTRD